VPIIKKCVKTALRLEFYERWLYDLTMALFLLGVFPLLLGMGLCIAPNAGVIRLKALFAGLFFGALLCAVKALFIFPSRQIRADFVELFWSAYAELFFSLLILGFLFFLVFGGSQRQKTAAKYDIAHALFFLFAAFFSIAIPYNTLSFAFAPSFFELCLMPLMYALLTLDVSICARAAFNLCSPPGASPKKRALAAAFFFLAFAAAASFPSAAQASRAAGGKAYAVLALVFVFLSAVVIFLGAKKANRQSYETA
jgi:hypothetical protein